MQIVGAWLTADGTDLNPQVTVASGSGLTLGGVSIVNDGQLNVDYAVGSNPSSAGDHGIQVTTVAGQSNSYNVLVGDPTPVISSITSPWNAGATYPCGTIQIAGSGFGTNPTVQIVSADGGNEIASYGICGSNDGLITLSVTTNVSYTPGSVNVSVTSRGYTGYNGNSFQPSQQNNSNQSAQTTVQVNADAAPLPRFVWGQGFAACQAANPVPGAVVVGQQIALTACIQLSGGAQIQSESWAPLTPGGTAVGNYTVTYDANNVATSASVQPVINATCGTSSSCTYGPFYWVDQGSRTFTFSYTLTSGVSRSASVTLNVTGPTNASIAANPANPVIVRQAATGPVISLGQSTPATSSGMQFSVTPTPSSVQQSLPNLIGPHANYQLVQVVNAETITERTDKGVFSCVPKALSSPTPIDVNYPYPSNQLSMTSNDSPASGLNYSTMGAGYSLYEFRRDFSVTMYLMFDPALPSGNDSSSCFPAFAASQTTRGKSACHGSIPVPIGSLSWRYCANGLNSLNPSWIVTPNCSINGVPSGFVSGTTYPTWQTVVVNRDRSTALFECTPKN